jgi:hypothetical protein
LEIHGNFGSTYLRGKIIEESMEPDGFHVLKTMPCLAPMTGNGLYQAFVVMTGGWFITI